MSDNAPEELGSGLIRIHRVITRAIDVARQRSHAHANGEPIEGWVGGGFADYVHTLVSVVRGHHGSEEEIAFPSFRDKFPDAPWDLIEDEHRAVLPILSNLDRQATAIGQQALPDAWAQAADMLDDLALVWGPHHQREEAHFSVAAIAAAVPPEEQATLVEKISAHTQQHTGPDYLVLPFLLFNLDGDDRRAMAALFPAPVTQQLVPGVWQEKWAAMKPFLLA